MSNPNSGAGWPPPSSNPVNETGQEIDFPLNGWPVDPAGDESVPVEGGETDLVTGEFPDHPSPRVRYQQEPEPYTD